MIIYFRLMWCGRWDTGICTMHRGEKCVLACRADYAYGDAGSQPKIPPGATLLFEVELYSWKEQRKEKWELNQSERLSEAGARKEDVVKRQSCQWGIPIHMGCRMRAGSLKTKGGDAFKAGKFAEALELYVDAADYLEEEFHSVRARTRWMRVRNAAIIAPTLQKLDARSTMPLRASRC